MKCNCGSESFFTEIKGNNTGIYCSKCGKWQKWGTKEEIRLLNQNTFTANEKNLIRTALAYYHMCKNEFSSQEEHKSSEILDLMRKLDDVE